MGNRNEIFNRQSVQFDVERNLVNYGRNNRKITTIEKETTREILIRVIVNQQRLKEI